MKKREKYVSKKLTQKNEIMSFKRAENYGKILVIEFSYMANI